MMAAELNRDDALQRQAYRRLNREDPYSSCRREDEEVVASRSDVRHVKIGDKRLPGVGMANLCWAHPTIIINVIGD